MEMSVLGTVDTKSNYNKNSLTNVVEKAHAGNTLLFLGAGFSIGCENKANKPIPLAKELSEIICKLGDFEVDDDLAFSADYYLKYHEASTLISLIKNYFTVVNASDHHQQVANVNWRRVYTTNYDNCFEVASIGVKKAIQPVTLLDNPTKYFRSRDICVHINGSVQCVGVDSLDQSFKLSDSSYTNSDAFTDSSWYYRFKKDIELCSQIIFVGYSLYDMEVKRLLLDNDDIKNKTFFITRKDISKKEHHRLSAFGEIFPIGVESFASLVSKTRPQGLPEDIKYLSSFERQFIDFEDRYGDSDIRDFLLRGKCSSDYLASSLTVNSARYAVEREQVKEVLDILKQQDIVVLHGSLANGKSTIAKQVMASLVVEGKYVYLIKDEEACYEDDIDKLATLDQQIYLFIDDFEGSLDLIKYYTHTLQGNGKLILAERPHRYRKAVRFLTDLKLETYNVNVDYMHTNEIAQLEQIITNTGLWGAQAG